MSALLDDIINSSLDEKQSLPDILRKCLLLSREIKDDKLKKWANPELGGYQNAEVPPYRIVVAPAHCTASNMAWRHPDQIIPSLMLKPEHRHFCETVSIAQSISSIADMVSKTDVTKGTLSVAWPANLVAL